MSENFTTPSKEWADFTKRVLEPGGVSADINRNMKIVFFGALSAATDFYLNLLSGTYSPAECDRAHKAWMTDLKAEMDNFEMMLMRDMEVDDNGRTN